MADHPLIYTIHVGPFRLEVREISGTEHFNQAWRLDARFVLDPRTLGGTVGEFTPDAVYKKEARVRMERDGQLVREITGIVSEVELFASISGHPEVKMVLEPRLALLKHRRDVRIHRNLDAPQIVTEVCTALGVKIDNRLTGSYPNRPYCVQWRETDYDYVMRLMEDEGIFYYFTAGDVMVLGDSPSAYEAIPGDPQLPHRYVSGINQNEDAVHEIGARAEITPGQVTLRDWNTEHPDLDMDVSAGTDVEFGPEWYDYPGEYEEPSEGARKARLHAEAMNRTAAAITGRSTCGRLYPGSTFVLTEAPVGIPAGGHVVRKVEHAWNREEEGYDCSFEADSDGTTFRPPRTTYVPRILNPHTGIVCTNGEDIQCDHFGRVKVHFHWDRLRPYDDDCSHWIPSLQDNTGGSSAIPRKDWEMVVHYLEGDPDRPIIIGRVYNAEDPFSEQIPHGKDRSGLMSRTSPDRDTANEIRFEDLAGLQRLMMRTPKDMNIRVANDQTSRVGRSNTRSIGNDETVEISGDATWDIGGRMEPSVGGNQEWKVQGDRTKKVGAGESCAIGGDHELTITGEHKIEVFADVNFGANNLTETFEANCTEKYETKHTTELSMDMTFTVGAALTVKCDAGYSEQVTSDLTETIKTSQSVDAGGQVQLRCDRTRTLEVGGSLMATCLKHFTMTGAEQFRMRSKTADWIAGVELHLKVNDGEGNESFISMKDECVWMKAMNDINITIGGSADQGASKSKQDGGSPPPPPEPDEEPAQAPAAAGGE